MKTASEVFLEAVGERVIQTDATQRFAYKALRGLEEHHLNKHSECAERMAAELRAMAEIAGL